MNILIVNNSLIPALYYGGTERVIWYLGKELSKLGHKVSYLVAAGSSCKFADVYVYNKNKDINSQIPEHIDIVHFNFPVNEFISRPYIVTIHGNSNADIKFDYNTVFVSQNHALRYNSDSFVYNGLDWDDYGVLNLNSERYYFHFLANAAWRVKNLKDSITIAKEANEKLAVIGGKRINFKMGFRFTISNKVKFYGVADNVLKNNVMTKSKALIFPVLWDEPFGLSIIESMYFGCPVFGTTFGSLPELVKKDMGFLSNSKSELVEASKNANSYNKKQISDYAIDNFNSKTMALEYLKKYQIVLNGKKLNDTLPSYNASNNLNKFVLC